MAKRKDKPEGDYRCDYPGPSDESEKPIGFWARLWWAFKRDY